MLEKPAIQDDRIIARLKEAYEVNAAQVEFLPLGVDANAAVYRAESADGTPYFAKLQRGAFDDIAVELPRFLSDRGVAQIIAPVMTNTGRLWTTVDEYALALYPYVEGQDGYHVALTERQWFEFGAALRKVHTINLPPALGRRIAQETYPARWREEVRRFLGPDDDVTHDDAARRLSAFLAEKHNDILHLVERAEALARALQSAPPPYALCHSDVHAGNLHVTPSGTLYIVDWDNPIMAPKERDLMFVGGGQGFIGLTADEEEAFFYRGYGPAQVDQRALAYYRYERIVEDLAAFGEFLLLSSEGGEDRAQALVFVKSNWLPGNTIEAAYRSDRTLQDGKTH